MTRFSAFLLVLTLVGGIFLAGCNKDVDPHAKVDAPDYYNGPMEPRGGNKGGGE